MRCDIRLAGIKKWYIGPSRGLDMRVPDVVLLSVCFLFIKNHKTGNFQEVGTAFFVNLKSEAHSENRFTYLVTAKHIIDRTIKSGASSIYVRLNKKPSGVDFVEIAISAWVSHKDQTVDACVLPGNSLHAEFEFADIDAVDMFATDERLEKDNLGIGDELQMIGLFSPLKGENRNHPIVRIGHLAAMPGPLISHEGGGKIRGYLADMRSIGGHSGAPVYVIRKNPTRRRKSE